VKTCNLHERVTNRVINQIREYFPDKTRRGQILAIALPIMGGMMSQNVLNLVDAGMVGRLGDSALAAAGIGSFATYMSIAFILGLSTGVQALAARRLGEGRNDETAVPLNGGLMLAVMLGIPISLIMISIAPKFIALLSPDPEVVGQASSYLQVRVIATVAVGMNFSFRGYWSAVHMTGLYLRTILIMHALNIFLNWVLIFGNLGAPALGVYGAGLATTISLYVGTVIYFYLAWRHASSHGFLHKIPNRKVLGDQFKLSLPTSIQQLLFSGGMVMLFWILGQIGTGEVAAGNILMTFMLTALLPAMSIGIAASTLVGNALGRKDAEDARRWGWNTTVVALLYGFLVSIVFVVAGKPLLGIFLVNPETLALAYKPLLFMAAVLAIDLAGLTTMHALFGAGDTKTPAMISIIGQWLVFLPLAYLVGPVLGYGLLGVWIAQGIYRGSQALLFMKVWQKGRWAEVRI